jgi:hypothetical protein
LPRLEPNPLYGVLFMVCNLADRCLGGNGASLQTFGIF